MPKSLLFEYTCESGSTNPESLLYGLYISCGGTLTIFWNTVEVLINTRMGPVRNDLRSLMDASILQQDFVKDLVLKCFGNRYLWVKTSDFLHKEESSLYHPKKLSTKYPLNNIHSHLTSTTIITPEKLREFFHGLKQAENNDVERYKIIALVSQNFFDNRLRRFMLRSYTTQQFNELRRDLDLPPISLKPLMTDYDRESILASYERFYRENEDLIISKHNKRFNNTQYTEEHFPIRKKPEEKGHIEDTVDFHVLNAWNSAKTIVPRAAGVTFLECIVTDLNIVTQKQMLFIELGLFIGSLVLSGDLSSWILATMTLAMTMFSRYLNFSETDSLLYGITIAAVLQTQREKNYLTIDDEVDQNNHFKNTSYFLSSMAGCLIAQGTKNATKVIYNTGKSCIKAIFFEDKNNKVLSMPASGSANDRHGADDRGYKNTDSYCGRVR